MRPPPALAGADSYLGIHAVTVYDIDRNVFELVSFDEVSRSIEMERRAAAANGWNTCPRPRP